MHNMRVFRLFNLRSQGSVKAINGRNLSREEKELFPALFKKELDKLSANLEGTKSSSLRFLSAQLKDAPNDGKDNIISYPEGGNTEEYVLSLVIDNILGGLRSPCGASPKKRYSAARRHIRSSVHKLTS